MEATQRHLPPPPSIPTTPSMHRHNLEAQSHTSHLHIPPHKHTTYFTIQIKPQLESKHAVYRHTCGHSCTSCKWTPEKSQDMVHWHTCVHICMLCGWTPTESQYTVHWHTCVHICMSCSWIQANTVICQADGSQYLCIFVRELSNLFHILVMAPSQQQWTGFAIFATWFYQWCVGTGVTEIHLQPIFLQWKK